MKFKHFNIALFLLMALPGLCQTMEGVVTYERVYHWSKIYSRLTFLSQEEKDRIKLTWGNDDESKTKMQLFFTPNQSKYTYASDQGTSESGSYSWRQEDYIIFRDYEKESKVEIMEMLGKTYVIEDSLRAPRWKVLNQIKDVNGHVCMLAVTEDTVKKQKISAWFAHDLPISAGPERYFGLPGIILELDVNEGDFVITATNIELKPVGEGIQLPKKIKGKKLTDASYEELISTHISDSMKSHRNPYWSIPY
ncbi:GLPGLI family protein [Arundinibacter roseus]|uniref:GLPGLI family protein n=1 Tax=Arundinibacter roseus TaxID=2070510 RepID=A0A4R4KDH3_9BACT|nr:GLPGLI family protein [Arundinibacter roseus]TDB64571.1 GLPGLI family protein [Arundinibacter roseus]